MTQQRRDNNSTEFGLWIRKQPTIDSDLGYVTTNIDYVWSNYKSGKWFYLEEKRYGWMPKPYQVKLFKERDADVQGNENYCGFHFLIFTHTSPDDGAIYLDGKYITTTDLLEFLAFNKSDDWYQSWWPPLNVIRINCNPEMAIT